MATEAELGSSREMNQVRRQLGGGLTSLKNQPRDISKQGVSLYHNQ